MPVLHVSQSSFSPTGGLPLKVPVTWEVVCKSKALGIVHTSSSCVVPWLCLPPSPGELFPPLPSCGSPEMSFRVTASFWQQGSDSSEPPRGATGGSLRPRGSSVPVPSSTQSPESKPMKTASVLLSTELNRVHSPSSAPFILNESQTHKTQPGPLPLDNRGSFTGLPCRNATTSVGQLLDSCSGLCRKPLSILGHLGCHTLMRAQENHTEL